MSEKTFNSIEPATSQTGNNGMRALILIIGGLIAALSIIYGFDKVKQVGDPYFILVFTGLLSGPLSMIVQHWYTPQARKQNSNSGLFGSPQGLMALASIGVVIAMAIYLYFSYVKAA